MLDGYNVPIVDSRFWEIEHNSLQRLKEAELLLASILGFVNDIPDEDKISNENYIILQRLAGKIEQFLGDD